MAGARVSIKSEHEQGFGQKYWLYLDDLPAGVGSVGPQGETGPAGPEGPAGDGEDGLSAYEVAVVEGFEGDITAWLASLVGAQGEVGPQGSQGTQGDQGPQGDEGAVGAQGEEGLSAYEVAVVNGFGGNEAAWLASLVGGGKPFVTFTPFANNPPASAYATLDSRNAHIVLDFDGATDEEAVFAGVLNVSYGGGGLTCDIYVAFTSATSGSVRFQAGIERIDASSLDIDADSIAAFQSAGGTAPGTSGQVIKVSIAFTDGAQMDSLAAGEAYRLKIRRDADGTSGTDDITTDAEVLRVVLRET